MKSVAIAAAACLSVSVIAVARGASALTPNTGHYEAPVGGIKHLTFSYSTFRYPHVGFMTIEERQANSRIFDYFPGDAVVHEGKFHFAGHYFGRVLQVTGEWTTHDAVKGTVTLPDGTKKDYHATRIVSTGGGLQLPPPENGVHPDAGHYRGPYVNGTHVEFTYHASSESEVVNFRTVGEAGHTYFALAHVHEGAFTWTSHEHPLLRVVGHWTSPHDVVGFIGDQHGGDWEFHARLQ